METYVLPIILTLLGSGVWTVLLEWVKMKSERVTTERKMLLGLGHDALYNRLTYYLKQGYIEPDDLENLEYLYKPYRSMGGNGTCEVLYEKVCRLPQTKGDE